MDVKIPPLLKVRKMQQGRRREERVQMDKRNIVELKTVPGSLNKRAVFVLSLCVVIQYE